ncbi:MAG: hypothetical protein KBA53_12760, partial [Thermoclostridium sp.]|nr:hypothetical protein [Thermoclostridium sp.]
MRSFDDFQKEYTADGEKSYFTLSIPVDEQFKQYQTGMLEKNRLDLLLPLVVQRVNDDWKLSYDITSKIPLGRVLERKSLRHHEFDFIIRQFAALVHVLKEYLLDLPCVVFDKNYIFCDPADFTLFFVYIPVKSSESEPERIKNFLRKLIVEDIRLVDDISGSLLKKLLEALKSEAFTSELLYQCLDSTDVNQQVKSNVYATDLKEDFSNKAFTAEVYPNVPTRLDNSLEGTRHDENKNKQVQNNHPFSRSNTEHTPPPRPRKPAAIPSRESVKTVRTHETISCKAPVRKMNNMKPGFAFLQKYPKSSWLIAGGVNLLLLAILVYIIASVGKNPSNAVSNIAGFLLIAAAGNYFLCTRLFSKEKKLPVVEASIETRSAAFKKRFEFENDEEDIILPKNPAASFQRENNREKVVLPPVSHAGSSSSDRAIPGSDRTNDSNQADRTTPIFGMNQENGGKLNQKAQSAEALRKRADSAALSVEPEIEKSVTHSVL